MHNTHQVYRKNNGTGPVEMFICHLMKNVHCTLQNSSLGKLYTAGSGSPTPGNSDWILLAKLLSVGQLQPFGCCPHFQSDVVWLRFLIFEKAQAKKIIIMWIELRGTWRLCNHKNTFVGQRFIYRECSVRYTARYVAVSFPQRVTETHFYKIHYEIARVNWIEFRLTLKAKGEDTASQIASQHW